MCRALLVIGVTFLTLFPVSAQRGGGGHGGNRGAFGGGRRGGFGGGKHGAFGGGMHGSFHTPFPNNFRLRNFDRSRSRSTFGSPGFGGCDADYGYPNSNGYPDGYSQDYDSSNIGHQSGVSAVVAVRLTEHIYSYVPVDHPTAAVAPAIHDYASAPKQGSSYEPGFDVEDRATMVQGRP